MQKIKRFVKKILPTPIKNIIVSYLSRPIYNYFNTKYKKKALLSYVTLPFRSNYLTHTSSYEAISWAKILHELQYSVDIIDYDLLPAHLNLAQYDLICGFGDVFQKYFETPYLEAKTICYATGMHVCFQNNKSLKRVKDVYKKKGVWLGASARFVEKTWTHQTSLVNGIIALGNNICANSYRKYYDGKILSVPATFFKVIADTEINLSKKKNKNFLWFGSYGLIHKGLDLVLDYFAQHPELTLHVCGDIDKERDFVNIYKKELYETSNIITHGFVDIQSELFKNLLNLCLFVIYPSCSEGGAPSVLTIIGNGGLIPIITKETCISTGAEIWIETIDSTGIDKSIQTALTLNNHELFQLQKKNYEYVNWNNSQKKYYDTLQKSIIDILG